MSSSKPNAVLVDGKLISGQDLRDYATRLGLCQTCAQHKTHKKAGSILNRSWEPITAIDEQGMYTVYKGYCLQPTCYTFGKAQELLGERTTRRSHRRKGRSSRGIVVAKSTSSLMASTATEATTTDASSSFFKTRPASYNTPADFLLTGPIRTIAHEALPKERPSPAWDASVDPKTPTRSPKTILKPPPSSPTTFVLQQLEDTKERADCTTILNIMHGCCHDSEVAHKALTYLRQTIVQSHKEMEIDSVFRDRLWTRIVGSTMKIHESRVNVVSEGVLLWMTLCALSPVYTEDIQREGGIGILLSLLQLHATNLELQERCCATLMECSNLSSADLLSTESQILEELVKALVLKLASPSDHCRDCAVVSLFRISRSQGLTLPTEGDDVLEHICKTLVSQDGVGHLWELLQTGATPEQAKEGAAHLLWRLVASANVRPQGMSGERVNPTKANVGSVVKLLQGSGSPFLVESACGLLASMSCNDIVCSCADDTHAIFQAVFGALSKFPKSQGIQTHGVNIFRDMLSKHSPEVLEEQDQGFLAAIVLRAMHRFPECMELQDVGCQVVAYACDRYEGARQVAASSGTTVIMRAFQSSVTRDGSTSDSGVRGTYLAAISSLNRLSSGTGAAMLVLNKSQIVLDLELAMEKEKDPHVLESLLRIVSNVLPSMLCEQEAEAKDERAGKNVTSNLIYHVLNATERADSADFKRGSCRLLALLYREIPLESFNQHSSVVSVGLYKMSIQRHHRRELEVIEKIMRTHLDDSAIQETGCISLFNFWSAVASNRGVESRDLGSSENLTQLASSGLDLILNVTGHHQSDIGLQIRAIRLFWVLTIVCETKQRNKREAQLVRQILDSVDNFGESMELLSATGDILKSLVLQKKSLPLIGSSSVISILIRMLHLGNEHVVTRSSQVLDVLLNNRFDASRILAENENGIEKIKLCMAQYPSSEELQQRLCSVVESLVVLLDNRFISELTDSVCLKALTVALSLYPNNERLVESACRAIVGLLADTESSVLWTARITLSEAVMGSLEGTLKCPDAQKAAVDVLYALCTLHPRFKLLVAGSIPSLLRSLNAYPAKADFLRNGCAIIRLVASSGENMDIVGRKDTVGCIVNSMLIHPESTSLVMECLATVNYLAAEDSTRKTLRHCEVEDACICLLRINSQNDKIVGAVLAALNNIAVDSRSRSVSPMKSGVLDVLLMAMARYPESNSVQTQGCLLLKNYTYEHASFQAMKNRADDLVSLLVVSAENNSEECGDRAHYIMQKLL